MRILITGGAGFIGSNFIRYLLNKYPEYKVINLDKLTYCGNLENLKDIENNPNYKFVKGDICDEKIVNTLAGDVEVIVNFAAETHVDRSILDASEFIRTNVYGTYVLLEAARKYNISRYIQISTDEVFGSIENGSFKEDDTLHPNSPYAASKAGADHLVQAYYMTYNLPVIITRSGNNFGPYQYPEKVIPLFITNALEDKKLPLYGDGLNVRDWLYVLDNCRAIGLVLHKGKIGEVYNIAAGNEKANIELTKIILKIMGGTEGLIEYVNDRPGHDRRYSIDSNKIKSLGWQPQYPFEQALKETVRWYQDNQQWWKRIKS
ncbi:MAG: dTDP-glucose 4,6-dehydratase [Candidatus Omnitrophota bacterium]